MYRKIIDNLDFYRELRHIQNRSHPIINIVRVIFILIVLKIVIDYIIFKYYVFSKS